MSETPPNRRRSRRGTVRASVRIECRKGTTGLTLNLATGVLDISETGIRLILNEQLDLHQETEILLSAAGVMKTIRRIASVVWTAELADGQRCAGLAFDKPLPFADVQRFTP